MRDGPRIQVVGTSGAGKTTFARRLAAALGARHVELDALCWGTDWIHVGRDTQLARARRLAEQPKWVVCGNWSVLRPLLFPRLTHLVWLDYPRRVVWSRVLRRTARRILRREVLWAGNRESLTRALASRDSILLWSLTTYASNREKYEALFAELATQAGGPVPVRLRSPREAERWIRSRSAAEERRAEPGL